MNAFQSAWSFSWSAALVTKMRLSAMAYIPPCKAAPFFYRENVVCTRQRPGLAMPRPDRRGQIAVVGPLPAVTPTNIVSVEPRATQLDGHGFAPEALR